jgi:hypothetical protein
MAFHLPLRGEALRAALPFFHKQGSRLGFLLIRWRLVLQVIPMVFCAICLRAAVWSGGPLPFVLDSSVVASFVTAGVFVCGLLLNGIMADWKESEKVVSIMEPAFSTIVAFICAGAERRKFSAFKRLRMLQQVDKLLDTVLLLAEDSISYSVASKRLLVEDSHLQALMESAGHASAVVQSQILTLRNQMARVEVIAHTSFFLPAFSLFDCVSAALIIMLSIVFYASPSTGYINVGIFSFCEALLA